MYKRYWYRLDSSALAEAALPYGEITGRKLDSEVTLINVRTPVTTRKIPSNGPT